MKTPFYTIFTSVVIMLFAPVAIDNYIGTGDTYLYFIGIIPANIIACIGLSKAIWIFNKKVKSSYGYIFGNGAIALYTFYIMYQMWLRALLYEMLFKYNFI